MTTIHESRPFNLRYIVRAPGGIHGDDRRATHRTALCNYLYIVRENGEDEFGPTPDFAARRADLVAVGRAGPLRSHAPVHAGPAIWAAADAASREPRPELATAMHAVGSLPPELHQVQWERLIAAFCDTQLAARGMVVDWAIQVFGAAGLSNDTFLAHAFASARLLRFADGPDEVHRNAIAKIELAKHR